MKRQHKKDIHARTSAFLKHVSICSVSGGLITNLEPAARMKEEDSHFARQNEEDEWSTQEGHSLSYHAVNDERDFFWFDALSAPAPAQLLFDAVATQKVWRPVLLLISYLNLQYHISHRACKLVINTSRTVLSQSDSILSTDKLVSTLQTTFDSVELKNQFLILLMCSSCRRVFSINSSPELKCNICFSNLFKSRSVLQTDFDEFEIKTEEL